jgi:hypothetical protein
MLTDFQIFHEFIEPRLPGGIPGPSLERSIRDAAIELYRDLQWLQEYPLNTISLKANQAVYELQSPEPEMAVCDVVRVICNGVMVQKRERPFFDTFVERWEVQTSAAPTFYMILGYDDIRMQIQLVPFPNADTTASNTTGLTVRVSCCPTTVSRKLDGSAFTMMRYAIAAWVLRDLSGQRGMPWFDRDAERVHDAEFLKYKGQLMMQREVGQGRAFGLVTTCALGIYPRQP